MTFRNIQVLLKTNVRTFQGEMTAAGRAVDALQRKLETAEKRGSGLGKSTSIWTKALIGGVALAAISLGVFVMKAASFEAKMRNVATISEEARRDFDGVSASVLNLSRRLPQSAETLAEGLYDVASSGFAGASGMKVLTASAEAASAGLTTTATSARAITAVLNAYGKGAEDAEIVSDVLFQTVNLGVITFEELAQSVGDFVGTAAAAKVPIEDAGTAIAVMTRAGLTASESGVSLNRVLQSLIQPSDALTKVYRSMEIESGAAALETHGLRGVMELLRQATGGEVTALLELFPEIRAARGALALMSDEGRTYASVAAEVADLDRVQGATKRALAEQAKGLSFQVQILKNNLESFAIRIGLKVIPAVESFLQILIAAGGWVARHDELIKALAFAIGTKLVLSTVKATASLANMAGTAVFSSVKMLIGLVANLGGNLNSLATAAGTTRSAMLSAAAGQMALNAAVLGGAAAIVAVGYAWYRANQQADAYVKSLREQIGDPSSIEEHAQAINTVGDSLDRVLSEVERKGGGQKLFGFAGPELPSIQQIMDIPKMNKVGELLEETSIKALNYGDNLQKITIRTRGMEGVSRRSVEAMAKHLGVDLAQAGEKGVEAQNRVIRGMQGMEKQSGVSFKAMQEHALNDVAAMEELAKSIAKAKEAASAAFMKSVDIVAKLGAETNLTAASLKKFYTDNIKEGQAWADNLQSVISRGLDPQFVQRLLEAGPEAAGPLLQQISGDHSNRLIEMVNKSEEQLRTINSRVVEFARLTQLAVGSSSDKLSKELPAAMKIAAEIMKKPHITAAEIAASLGIAGLTADEVSRIAKAFGISVGGAAVSGLAQGAKGSISIEARQAGVGRKGGAQEFARGGIRHAQEGHVAQVARAGEWRVWAEPETGGEAYIPLGITKRGRSTRVLAAVANEFGYSLTPMQDGGMMVPLGRRVTGGPTYQVHIGQIVSAEPGKIAPDLSRELAFQSLKGAR